ncbi:MAG TPA: TetR/AcrR family transcriptional regulator C-terminal domain-containing protein [Galbitalea sp.]|jgi:AcrR family transcriptional regulator
MDPLNDEALPRAIALAWGVAASPQRGPRRELNIERIVETAVQLADEHGLGAVSMSSVATALGFTTMSLYRYVTAKDDLVLLMQESALGVPPLSVTDSTNWREGLTRWYRASLEMYAAHPWVLDITISGEPNTPNNLAWLDAGLGVLEHSRLDERSRISAVLLVSGNSRWEAQVLRGLDSESAFDPRMLASLVTAEQFPHLYPTIVSGAYAADDNPFEFGLSRILDGLEHYMDASPGEGAYPAPPAEPKEIARDERVRKARAHVKDVETKLRDARQKEREAVAKARETAAKSLGR